MDLMLMLVRTAARLHLVFSLILIHRVSSAGYAVRYSRSHICALKDSTVIMSCSYLYPTGLQIRKVFWTKELKNLPDLSGDPEYSKRLQYLGDRQQNSTVRLSHVTLEDSHEYYFRFTTDQDKWLGKPGVRLSVTDLHLESPERVTEGDSVHLTCKSSCELTDRPTFIWSRNSQRLPSANTGNKLTLSAVTRGDAGTYRCAVDGHNLTSDGVQLNVTYPPDKPEISISGSGEIVEGDSVSLICETDSNPPAQIHWIKGGTIVGSGGIYNISNISVNDSGEYKCRSNNIHGEKDSTVTLYVMYPPRNVSVLINGSAEIYEGDSVSLICETDSNPPAEIHWFKENQSSSVGSGQSFSVGQSGRFYCRAHNRLGSHTSHAVSVTVRPAARVNVIAIKVASGVFIIIIIIITLFIMRKRKNEALTVKQVNQPDMTNDLYSDVSKSILVQDSAADAAYATVKPKRVRGQTEEIEYSTVQFHRNTPMEREESECQYANIRVQQIQPVTRESKVRTVDANVIYSTVK